MICTLESTYICSVGEAATWKNKGGSLKTRRHIFKSKKTEIQAHEMDLAPRSDTNVERESPAFGHTLFPSAQFLAIYGRPVSPPRPSSLALLLHKNHVAEMGQTMRTLLILLMAQALLGWRCPSCPMSLVPLHRTGFYRTNARCHLPQHVMQPRKFVVQCGPNNLHSQTNRQKARLRGHRNADRSSFLHSYSEIEKKKSCLNTRERGGETVASKQDKTRQETRDKRQETRDNNKTKDKTRQGKER